MGRLDIKNSSHFAYYLVHHELADDIFSALLQWVHDCNVTSIPRKSTQKSWTRTLAEYKKGSLPQPSEDDVPLDFTSPCSVSNVRLDDTKDLLEEVSRASSLHEQLTGDLTEKLHQQQFFVRQYLTTFHQYNRSLSRIYASLLQPDLLEFQQQLQEGHASLEFVFKNLGIQRVWSAFSLLTLQKQVQQLTVQECLRLLHKFYEHCVALKVKIDYLEQTDSSRSNPYQSEIDRLSSEVSTSYSSLTL